MKYSAGMTYSVTQTVTYSGNTTSVTLTQLNNGVSATLKPWGE
jgi:hypothetical protein